MPTFTVITHRSGNSCTAGNQCILRVRLCLWTTSLLRIRWEPEAIQMHGEGIHPGSMSIFREITGHTITSSQIMSCGMTTQRLTSCNSSWATQRNASTRPVVLSPSKTSGSSFQ